MVRYISLTHPTGSAIALQDRRSLTHEIAVNPSQGSTSFSPMFPQNDDVPSSRDLVPLHSSIAFLYISASSRMLLHLFKSPFIS
ncbi:hypothetical protein [Dolichospermum circinale]|uniref:hypothetical protein n=1 Tax=Dolichospermum circinale TaxID=109265 RepID=UPI0012DFD379|nr:hypothetical protein [Dolichospermum circinale]MDB9475509.1 hypothetical protein [Dolichospermum circinale CS-537/11]MDB9477573.1 hypothetical protein [Dolichospermum circinale CS-537/03]